MLSISLRVSITEDDKYIYRYIDISTCANIVTLKRLYNKIRLSMTWVPCCFAWFFLASIAYAKKKCWTRHANLINRDVLVYREFQWKICMACDENKMTDTSQLLHELNILLFGINNLCSLHRNIDCRIAILKFIVSRFNRTYAIAEITEIQLKLFLWLFKYCDFAVLLSYL